MTLPTPAHPPVLVDVHLDPGFLARSLRADACAGLTAVPKVLPPKWFYDHRGSDLFDQITRLPEYYPTRREHEILRREAATIAAVAAPDTLVELGSGTSEKTLCLLDACTAKGGLSMFVPVDVAESFLRASADTIAARYPAIQVHGVVGDFEHHLGHVPGEGRHLVAFLGGTIGNLDPAGRAAFLADLATSLSSGDGLLLGTDLVKDPARLVRAYDDAAGVTAEFNRNVLHVLNRELGATFDPTRFAHVALWDDEQQWIEMRLRSVGDQVVEIPDLGLEVGFADGEEMRTEISAKFTRDRIVDELAAAGFEVDQWLTDDANDFGLSLSFLR